MGVVQLTQAERSKNIVFFENIYANVKFYGGGGGGPSLLSDGKNYLSLERFLFLSFHLSFLKREIQRVHAITRNETLKPSLPTTNQPSRVPLVITYNPALRSGSGLN